LDLASVLIINIKIEKSIFHVLLVFGIYMCVFQVSEYIELNFHSLFAAQCLKLYVSEGLYRKMLKVLVSILDICLLFIMKQECYFFIHITQTVYIEKNYLSNLWIITFTISHQPPGQSFPWANSLM